MNWKLLFLLALAGGTFALSACTTGNNDADDDDDAVGDDDDAVGDLPDGLECDDTGVDVTGDGQTDVLCVLQGTYTDDLTLTNDAVYLLRGGVFIGDDEGATVLTIDAGVTIFGETSTDGMLVVRRNSQLFAMGTADAPITMTSSKAAGERARGDWGGVIINGNAPINACVDDPSGDGVCEAFGEGGTGWYGGDDPADDSGEIHFLRIQFAGTLVSPDNELNGLALQAVGSATDIDHVQVHMNADDGIEFFGGTANARNLVLTGIGDDNLDWTDGWTGMLQYLVAQQYDGNGDNGIEADNNGDNNDLTPRSAPMIANVTLVGVPTSDASDTGIVLREGTAGDLINVVAHGWNDSCLDVDNDATVAEGDAGSLTMEYSLLDCGTNYAADDEEAWTTTWFTDQTGNVEGDGSTADLTDPLNIDAPDFTPVAGGTVATSGGDASAWDAWFDATDFMGGVGPDDNWVAGWTAFPAN